MKNILKPLAVWHDHTADCWLVTGPKAPPGELGRPIAVASIAYGPGTYLTPNQAKAMARLFASAPDLLEAVEGMMREVAKPPLAKLGPYQGTSSAPDLAGAWEQVLAVVSRIRGKEVADGVQH